MNRNGTTFNDAGRKIDTLPRDICGITGFAHTWKLQPYVKYISRATCDCGAVRFFSDVIDTEIIAMRDKYNQKHGKPGNIYKGPRIKQREGTMVAQINVKELHQETKEKLGLIGANSIKEHQSASTTALPPVPPRPDLTGVNHGNIGRVMNKYYEANAAAIIAERAATGDRETWSRWGFSECGYKNFLKRHGLEYKGPGTGHRSAKAPDARKVSNSVKPPAHIEAIDKKNGQPVEVKACDECGEVVTADGLGHKRGCAHGTVSDGGNGDKKEPRRAGAIDVLIAIERLKEMQVKLPEFPSFDRTWPNSVQEKWLETYAKLAVKA